MECSQPLTTEGRCLDQSAKVAADHLMIVRMYLHGVTETDPSCAHAATMKATTPMILGA